MPTPAPPPGPEPHRQRRLAESFGVDPERYDRTRPPYPDAMIERIVAASPGPDLLDVGCGTGIEARQFRAAGRRVLGVEPDQRMAGFARATGLEVEVATFEQWVLAAVGTAADGLGGTISLPYATWGLTAIRGVPAAED